MNTLETKDKDQALSSGLGHPARHITLPPCREHNGRALEGRVSGRQGARPSRLSDFTAAGAL